MTPEGKVKKRVKEILKAAGAYQHWPVQNGMGSPTLDCNGTYKGFGFSIETKAPGEKPTPRQLQTIEAKRAAKEYVLVVDGTDDYRCIDVMLIEMDCWDRALTDKFGSLTKPEARGFFINQKAALNG
jgi:hypothetical protein